MTEGDENLEPLLDEIVYIEEQLEYLKSLPQIKVHPKDKTKQKATPAAKMYKEMFQQYTSALRILLKATGADEAEAESPLRKWVNERFKKMDFGQ